MTDETNMKEVKFYIYCETCTHKEKRGFEDPCNECLEYPMLEGTWVPLNWEDKKNGVR